MTTAIIGLLGVDLGPTDQMLEANPDDNARGYWEQQTIYEINEEILGMFGGSWGHPPELPAGWERSPVLTAVRERARAALTDLFGTREHRWAWKDPRASIALPFWRCVIGEMDYVLCVRNPADVAMSLVKRGIEELDFESSVALWVHYVRAALESTMGSNRVILRYEDYFTDTDRQIRRLTEFVCGPETDLSAATRERIDGFIDPTLWHNRDSGAGLDRVWTVSPEAASLYKSLGETPLGSQPAGHIP